MKPPGAKSRAGGYVLSGISIKLPSAWKQQKPPGAKSRAGGYKLSGISIKLPSAWKQEARVSILTTLHWYLAVGFMV